MSRSMRKAARVMEWLKLEETFRLRLLPQYLTQLSNGFQSPKDVLWWVYCDGVRRGMKEAEEILRETKKPPGGGSNPTA